MKQDLPDSTDAPPSEHPVQSPHPSSRVEVSLPDGTAGYTTQHPEAELNLDNHYQSALINRLAFNQLNKLIHGGYMVFNDSWRDEDGTEYFGTTFTLEIPVDAGNGRTISEDDAITISCHIGDALATIAGEYGISSEPNRCGNRYIYRVELGFSGIDKPEQLLEEIRNNEHQLRRALECSIEPGKEIRH